MDGSENHIRQCHTNAWSGKVEVKPDMPNGITFEPNGFREVKRNDGTVFKNVDMERDYSIGVTETPSDWRERVHAQQAAERQSHGHWQPGDPVDLSVPRAPSTSTGASAYWGQSRTSARGLSTPERRRSPIYGASVLFAIISLFACIFLFTGSAVLTCTPEVCSYPMLLGVPDYDLALVAFVFFVFALIVAKFSSSARSRYYP